MPRLRRSDCAGPGIARRRRGRGFEYRDPDGRRLSDPEVLERISDLAIPPAWRDVWICMDSFGHLQATGRDAAGRKQYLYHPRWRANRDRLKFDSMVAFGKALPRLRRRVARDLRREGGARAAVLSANELTRERVLACAVRLLDLGFFRIGSEDYAEQNESYGLTTMLREHVSLESGGIIFDFPAKSGQRRVQGILDVDATAVAAALKRRRSGTQLLAYRAGPRWVECRADEVNAYIKRYAGETFSAKDFRTWNATVLAAVMLGGEDQAARSRAARRRAERRAVVAVAGYLGNTPAVSKASYIDPRVIDRYHAGASIADTLAALPSDGPDLAKPAVRRRVEAAVISLLADSSG